METIINQRNIMEQMRLAASYLPDYVYAEFNMKLDYSEKSLITLERMFIIDYAMDSDMTQIGPDSLAMAWGGFIGKVIRLTYGGT